MLPRIFGLEVRTANVHHAVIVQYQALFCYSPGGATMMFNNWTGTANQLRVIKRFVLIFSSLRHVNPSFIHYFIQLLFFNEN